MWKTRPHPLFLDLWVWYARTFSDSDFLVGRLTFRSGPAIHIHIYLLWVGIYLGIYLS